LLGADVAALGVKLNVALGNFAGSDEALETRGLESTVLPKLKTGALVTLGTVVKGRAELVVDGVPNTKGLELEACTPDALTADPKLKVGIVIPATVASVAVEVLGNGLGATGRLEDEVKLSAEDVAGAEAGVTAADACWLGASGPLASCGFSAESEVDAGCAPDSVGGLLGAVDAGAEEVRPKLNPTVDDASAADSDDWTGGLGVSEVEGMLPNWKRLVVVVVAVDDIVGMIATVFSTADVTPPVVMANVVVAIFFLAWAISSSSMKGVSKSAARASFCFLSAS
jgi:hypothetical protein